MPDKLETTINELYQLPLDEFTKARNALAKTLAGDDKRVVASLVKPTLPLWAINQLYWKDAGTYKALVDASEKLRAAHRAVLSGKNVDLKKPDEVHRTALERAAAKTASLLDAATGRVTEPVRETIRRTLAALPTDETAGRLTREPPPAGFGLLTGVTPRAIAREKGPAPARADDRAAEQARKKAEHAREQAVAAARQQVKSAQRAAERATFAVRKAEAELSKAQADEARAANQLKNAESKLAELAGTPRRAGG